MPMVAGLFRSSMELDKAINQLLSQRFQGNQLRVLPMHVAEKDVPVKGIRGWLMRGGVFGDTLDRSDGTSIMDGVAVGAVLGGLGGVIAGAAVWVGPVVLGVAGILGGGFLGLLCDRLIPEGQREEYKQELRKAMTLVLVLCESKDRADGAERILRENQAHQIGRMP